MAGLAVIALLGAGSSVALAQQGADPELLIRDGVALRKQGEDAKAHGYFQRAYDLAPTPRTSAQLGLCDLAVGRWLDAEVHLTEALDSNDPWVGSQRTALEQGRGRARAKLGKIAVTGAAPDALVTTAGRRPAKLPDDGQVWVSPGLVHVKVEAPGYQPVEHDVTVAEGKRAALEIQMPPLRRDPPPRLEQTEELAPRAASNEPASPEDAPIADARGRRAERSRPRRGDDDAWRAPLIWTAAGVGTALLGFGIYETVEYNSKIDAFNDPKRNPLCGDANGTIAGGSDCQRLATEGDRAKMLAVVGYVGAGALAITAVIVGLTGGSSGDADVASAGMSCAPVQGNGMQAGLNCALRF